MCILYSWNNRWLFFWRSFQAPNVFSPCRNQAMLESHLVTDSQRHHIIVQYFMISFYMMFFFSFQSRKVRDLCRHATCEATRKQAVHCTLGGRLIIGQPLLSSNHAPCFDHSIWCKYRNIRYGSCHFQQIFSLRHSWVQWCHLKKPLDLGNLPWRPHHLQELRGSFDERSAVFHERKRGEGSAKEMMIGTFF